MSITRLRALRCPGRCRLCQRRRRWLRRNRNGWGCFVATSESDHYPQRTFYKVTSAGSCRARVDNALPFICSTCCCCCCCCSLCALLLSTGIIARRPPGSPAASHPLDPRRRDIETVRSCSSSSSRGEGEGGGPSSEDPVDSEDGTTGDWREFPARLISPRGAGLLPGPPRTPPCHQWRPRRPGGADSCS